MASYIPKLHGYMADVPRACIKRVDGKYFNYTKLTQASVNPQVNYTEVNAGWGLYPVAYLPAASTFEMTLTSGEFDSSLFALANGADFVADAKNKVPYVEVHTVSESKTIELGEQPEVADVHINDFKIVSTGTATKGTAESDGTAVYNKDTKIITFDESMIGVEVEVVYEMTKANAVTLSVSNDKSAIAEVTLIWPVYSGGESKKGDQNFTGSSIMGYIKLHAPKVRVTAVPGFDTSYKSAATNAITLATMEPENGKNAYTITYIKNV